MAPQWLLVRALPLSSFHPPLIQPEPHLYFPPRTKLPYAGLLTHSGTVAPLAVATLVVPLWIARQGSYDVGDWRLEAVVTGSGSIWTREGTTRPVLVRDMGGR